jgi:hypothetical protein
MSKPDDLPFDLIQKTFLDTGEPITFYHISKDKEWAFIYSKQSHGWVKINNIAWNSKKNTIKNFIEKNDFIVALDWEIPIYSDSEFKYLKNILHMGSRLPVIQKTNDFIKLQLPTRDQNGQLYFEEGYIKNNNSIAFKYLPLTRRNIAKQSFKMLGEPYSWGGRDYKTDCSYFIKVVFQTMGLHLPRNSYGQVRTLKTLRTYKNNKLNLLNSMKPFESLLYHSDPGHIMLYIGEINGKHYIIHNKWSYKEKDGEKEKEILIKKTLITDLSLGENSDQGSIFNKISHIGKLK